MFLRKKKDTIFFGARGNCWRCSNGQIQELRASILCLSACAPMLKAVAQYKEGGLRQDRIYLPLFTYPPALSGHGRGRLLPSGIHRPRRSPRVSPPRNLEQPQPLHPGILCAQEHHFLQRDRQEPQDNRSTERRTDLRPRLRQVHRAGLPRGMPSSCHTYVPLCYSLWCSLSGALLVDLQKKVSAKELEELVRGDRKVPLIVDFYATWCGPCVVMAQDIEMVCPF